MERLKLILSKFQGRVYTARALLLSTILLIFVVLIDLNIIPNSLIPEIFYTKVFLARTLLTTLGGAFLTVATFHFTSIFTVLDQFSTIYTYRSMENFTNEKIPMKILGYYIGGFFYCVTALLVLRYAPEDKEVIAGTLAIFYSIGILGLFIQFVHKVLISMETENLFQDIYQESLPSIEREIHRRDRHKQIHIDSQWSHFIITASKTGYLDNIEWRSLDHLFQKSTGVLIARAMIGEEVFEHMPIADLYIDILPCEKDELLKKVEGAFSLHFFQMQSKDYRYGMMKLSEAAVRALQEHCDPYTAVEAIRKISFLLSKLATTDHRNFHDKAGDSFEFYYKAHSLGEDLYFAFYQILEYGKDNPLVIKAILEGLVLIYQNATKNNRKVVEDYAKSLEDIVKQQDGQPLIRQSMKDIYSLL
ncbi:MAG: DUF2254 family protein [Tissierellia bacterium]|nr:DUF2254 family protein [Tissierellia bacterium]